VSIVVFEQGDDSPVDLKQSSPVYFISLKDMRNACKNEQVKISTRKGFEEGSEIRLIWPCAAANQQFNIDSVESTKINLKPILDGRRRPIHLSRGKGKNKIKLIPQVNKGDTVEVNQIMAAVVPIYTEINCPPKVDEAYYRAKLGSINLSERYAAAKALRYRGYKASKRVLKARIYDTEEDIYVQLEAAAALAAYDDPKGWEFIESKLRSPTLAVPLETQLETVIVASEILKERSERLLIEVLQDTHRDDELRAGAAWALGQFASNASATALVDTFNSSPLEIKVEAARALLHIAEPQISHLVELLKNGDPSKRDGISWVLARTGKFNPTEMVSGADDNLRRWLSYIIGYGQDYFEQANVADICNKDPEIYFAASVLWQVIASWVHDLKEY
jgi:hypothetical protein